MLKDDNFFLYLLRGDILDILDDGDPSWIDLLQQLGRDLLVGRD